MLINSKNKTAKIRRAWLLLLIYYLCPLYTQAAEVTDSKVNEHSDAGAKAEETTSTLNSERPRFSIYKRNFVIWSVPEDRIDEQGLQIRFSAQYRFLECINKPGNGVSQATCAIFNNKLFSRYAGQLSISFSYTTDFDFYIRSNGNRELGRQSRPVRNRMTSPALHFNWERDTVPRHSGIQYQGFTASFVHHSNGQDLEFESLFTQETTDAQIRETIAELADSNPAWMDRVSRGWNYLEVLGRIEAGKNIPNCQFEFLCINVAAGVRLRLTDVADDIWWEPGNNSAYLDYNRFTVQIINGWGRELPPDSQFLSFGKKRFALELKCGSVGCSSNASLRSDVYVGEGNFQLPLMIYGHFGKNEHFYNYHERADMVGVGLEFSQ